MESSAISNETDFHKIDAKVTPSYFPTKALLPYSSLPTGSIPPHPPGTRLSIENPRSDTPLVRVEEKNLMPSMGTLVCIFHFIFYCLFFTFIFHNSPVIYFAFHHHGVAGHSSAPAMIRLRFSPGQKLYKFPGVMCFR